MIAPTTATVAPAADFFSRQPPDAEPSLFCSEAWIAAVDAAFAWNTGVIEAEGDYLPFTPIENRVGRRIVVQPYADCARDFSSRETLQALLSGLAGEFPHHSLSVRVGGPAAEATFEGWRNEPKAGVYRLACGPADKMWEGLSSAFQRGVRRATRDGVQVVTATGLEDLRRFHRLFVVHRAAKFGILSPPWKFFEQLHERFFAAGRGFILEAWANGHVIAGLLVLRHRDVLYYKYGASDLTALELRPNNLLFWTLLESATRDRIREIDLGMTWSDEGDAGLRRFKESLGARFCGVSFLSRRPEDYDLDRELAVRAELRATSGRLARARDDPVALGAAGAELFRYFN